MKPTLKNLFLLDGIGAFLTAFLLGVVLMKLEYVFGIPREKLQHLAIIACVFATYSIVCYIFLKKNRAPFLRFIAISNLIYCCVTLSLVFQLQEKITLYGIIYLILEVIIISAISTLELKSASKKIP